jgi:hypothetical protein
MSIDFSTSTGLEEIGSQALASLFSDLNTELGVQEVAGQTRDATLGEERGLPYVPLTLERITETNFHLGHRPSLIEAPINEYPSVSVMAYQSGPSKDQGDHVESWDVNLFVEIMVKSPGADKRNRDELHQSEEIVNKRIQRTTNAVVNVLQRDRTLAGTVAEVKIPPSIVVTDAFLRSEEAGFGPVWLWQGARLEFQVEKYADYH